MGLARRGSALTLSQETDARARDAQRPDYDGRTDIQTVERANTCGADATATILRLAVGSVWSVARRAPLYVPWRDWIPVGWLLLKRAGL